MNLRFHSQYVIMDQPTHLDYIISAANLHAFNYGLRGDTNPAAFRKVVDSVIVPEFTPKSGLKVQVSDNDPVPQSSGGGKSFEWLLL